MCESYSGALYSFLKVMLRKKMTTWNKVRRQCPNYDGFKTGSHKQWLESVDNGMQAQFESSLYA